MPAEIEAKFLNVDIEDIRARLKAAGAKLEQPMRLMRRDLFDHADDRYKNGGYQERLRIRDEGGKIAINYKRAGEDSPYAHELESTIDSYENMKQILEAVGLKSISYQETKRETWLLDETEVVIDEWPWLKPYIEIEGPSEEAIKAVAAKIGFSWEEAKYGSVDTAYRAEYPKMDEDDSISEVAIVKFDLPLPTYLKERQ
ncbi:MAG TPA: class IV adenylate cyclase [Candidatus Saccharimonadales bacterium]|nr:class IV adenylate cyclase [Candidatus Saccharimonadales bacterium]